MFALALAVMVNFLDRGIFALLVRPIKADLHLSDVQVSLIMGFAFTFFYVLLGLPVARLVDRGNRKRIMAIGIAVWSAMTALCGFAGSFWQLFLARVGAGVGETTSGPSAYSMLSDYFPPEKLPRAIAGMNIGFVAGSGLSLVLGAAAIGFVGNRPEIVVPVLGTFRSWQVVLLLVGMPGLIVAAIMLSVREPPRHHGHAAGASQPVTEVFMLMVRHWRVFIPMFAGLALRSVQMFGLQMWGPSFYQRTYGWSATQIGYVSGASLMVAMPIGLFLGSWLAEYYWKRGPARRQHARRRHQHGGVGTARRIRTALALALAVRRREHDHVGISRHGGTGRERGVAERHAESHARTDDVPLPVHDERRRHGAGAFVCRLALAIRLFGSRNPLFDHAHQRRAWACRRSTRSGSACAPMAKR